MRLEKVALVSEILASIAVIVSLIVLIAQVNENTEAINASARQSAAARIEERTMSVAANGALLEALAEMRAGKDIDLASPQGIQLRFFFSSLLTSVEEAFLQYEDGRLERDYLENRAARAIVPNFTNPTARAFLQVVRSEGHYDTDFLDWLDERFLQGED